MLACTWANSVNFEVTFEWFISDLWVSFPSLWVTSQVMFRQLLVSSVQCTSLQFSFVTFVVTFMKLSWIHSFVYKENMSKSWGKVGEGYQQLEFPECESMAMPWVFDVTFSSLIHSQRQLLTNRCELLIFLSVHASTKNLSRMSCNFLLHCSKHQCYTRLPVGIQNKSVLKLKTRGEKLLCHGAKYRVTLSISKRWWPEQGHQ